MKNAQQATRNEVNKQETTVRHKNDKKVLQMLETKDFSFIEASEGVTLSLWPITDSAIIVLQFCSTLYSDTWLNESVC